MTEHPIRLRNSLTGRKEPFVPIDPENVRMYVCGPTVYDRAHIGNARPVVVFDVLYRLLRHVYGAEHVTYVRNITDIDDKIMARARESGRPVAEITEETTDWFLEDMAALGALEPTKQPRATEWVPQMVAMIETLVEKGHAYAAEGHVLFAVESYAEYGALSKRSVDDMIAGARVEVAPYKRNPMDFVLWKPSAPDQPGWESPWGRGRPGWHIECSAMAGELLGEEFDIHGGGADLMFPHHENEIAQSRCAHPGCGFAKVWLHNGMIRVEGRKMAKSLGNFTTVHDLRETVPGEVIRLALLSAHYRQELDWTKQRVDEARKALDRWADLVSARPAATSKDALGRARVSEDFIAALADDLNTPAAIAVLHEIASQASESSNEGNAALAELFVTAELFGFDLRINRRKEQVESIHAGMSQAFKDVIEDLLTARAEARKSKDFARADSIRDAFAAAGVIVKDTPQGAEWELGPDFDPAKLEGVE